MGWSTRQIADLAGTTLKSVRHYHDVGLLDEPERASNGYKQYGVTHLVRLMQIKRLTDLGFSLADIAAQGDGRDHPEQALRTLDAELGATIERLQRARLEIAMLLHESLPTDLPPELGSAAVHLTTADRQFVTFASTVLSPTALDAYCALLRSTPRLPTDPEFDDLPADAGSATTRDLAERMAPHVRQLALRFPALFADTDGDRQRVTRALAVAVEDLYNPAQRDVLRQVAALNATDSE
ncbi:MerR family transcriptional regulator [Rhodococcus fascians]|uniref:MerR family transcriptional regulator n=1 Tax=Rhodococcoides fascians TaxID=1828 RepID=UPI0019602BC4|nr:MerR family transcriptional regulator [Rhodococcus fascians]MBM7244241.1 MerR family transcriptional regulator [Rhodococcus fascians]MBX5329462.1 MerR family transcriptional regulator [Rhodococcus fascians]MBY3810403.1 MerR family transcriptional regulator [Rhodococcus fascians]MBY3841974.1 MerR family transcriptional regulator [Rhodococcus fascians]MBY3844425.1 MerR family transcriptional regulator [Rhodococcus fascians]